MDILRQKLGPIPEQAWDDIVETADQALRASLSGRRVVDVTGPEGWEKAAINLGRVKIEDSEPIPGVGWGLRQVRPLVEIRAPFTTEVLEMDFVARGAKDPDLDRLLRAADAVARFEENAIYHGFEEGGIPGMIPSSEHAALPSPRDAEQLLNVVEQGLLTLRRSGVTEPYHLVLGPELYTSSLVKTKGDKLVYEHLSYILGGNVVFSPSLRGGVLLSGRGGDFELTLGQDISIGYSGQAADGEAQLYFTESFTFQVLSPEAVIAIGKDAEETSA